MNPVALDAHANIPDESWKSRNKMEFKANLIDHRNRLITEEGRL